MTNNSTWYLAKLKPKGLTFFSDSFYPNAKPAEEVLVFIRTIMSSSPNTARIQICNTLDGMIRQLAPYAAVGCFDVIRTASEEETEKLNVTAIKRKMDINEPTKRRANYVRGPAKTVSDAVQ